MKSFFLSFVLIFTFMLSVQAQGIVESPTFFKEYIVEEINKEQALTLIYNASDFSVLDVRTKEEFELGHIDKAVNIDFYSPDFDQQIAQLDKSQTYLLYCRSGARSAKAMEKFQSVGFKHLYHLKGGYLTWEKE